MQQQKYTEKFKLEVVLESYKPGVSLNDVCQKYGVPRWRVQSWQREFQKERPVFPREPRVGLTLFAVFTGAILAGLLGGGVSYASHLSVGLIVLGTIFGVFCGSLIGFLAVQESDLLLGLGSLLELLECCTLFSIIFLVIPVMLGSLLIWHSVFLALLAGSDAGVGILLFILIINVAVPSERRKVKITSGNAAWKCRSSR